MYIKLSQCFPSMPQSYLLTVYQRANVYATIYKHELPL